MAPIAKFSKYSWYFLAISLGRLVVPIPIIGICLPRTYEKLHCKGELQELARFFGTHRDPVTNNVLCLLRKRLMHWLTNTQCTSILLNLRLLVSLSLFGFYWCVFMCVNWPMNNVQVSNLNWRQFFTCHDNHVYFISIVIIAQKDCINIKQGHKKIVKCR